ncbi:NIPSNAP family protein [Nocardia sp. CA2R105]|uniref:NIPSNAP family protein n=1 Tax=Nocardia coffeae TaxID=2873381 RepID=UPI001CA7B4EE|nr:NIPSNAP family protein [Nocardia coffeae]MBY8855494.1 NIPSNAP family protein [Nocardia coffeae]
MIYRMQIYQAVGENLATFHDYFRIHLLPVEVRHGARLVGRWETDDGRVVAVWEYDDRESYEHIQAEVAADPATRWAEELRRELPPFFTERDEVFMRSASVAEALGDSAV